MAAVGMSSPGRVKKETGGGAPLNAGSRLECLPTHAILYAIMQYYESFLIYNLVNLCLVYVLRFGFLLP